MQGDGLFSVAYLQTKKEILKTFLDTQEVAGGCGKTVCCCVLARSSLGITSYRVLMMVKAQRR